MRMTAQQQQPNTGMQKKVKRKVSDFFLLDHLNEKTILLDKLLGDKK